MFWRHFERALPALQRSLLSTRLDYDYFSCLPGWAKQTLKEHQEDEREHLYTREKLEGADTHDPYWTAAMT